MYDLDQLCNGIKKRTWNHQVATGISFATSNDYKDFLQFDLDTTVWVLPSGYSIPSYPRDTDYKRPDLTTLVPCGRKARGIADCCYIRPWYISSLGYRSHEEGVLMAQVCPGDEAIFLWDLRLSSKKTLCKLCTQFLTRPVFKADQPAKHHQDCAASKTEGKRPSQRVIREARLAGQFQRETMGVISPAELSEEGEEKEEV